MRAAHYEAETEHGGVWLPVLDPLGKAVRRYDSAEEARDCTRYIRYAPVRILRVCGGGRVALARGGLESQSMTDDGSVTDAGSGVATRHRADGRSG